MKENRHNQVRSGGIIGLLFSCLCLCSCVGTTYEKYSATGQLEYKFKTNADFGATASGTLDDNLNTGLLPSLGGDQENTYVVAQTESQHKTVIKIGEDFRIEGPVVHSTGMAVVGKTVTRSQSIWAKLIGWWKGADVLENIELGKSADGVKTNNSNNAVKTNDSNNAVKINQSNNDRDVALEALKEE